VGADEVQRYDYGGAPQEESGVEVSESEPSKKRTRTREERLSGGEAAFADQTPPFSAGAMPRLLISCVAYRRRYGANADARASNASEGMGGGALRV